MTETENKPGRGRLILAGLIAIVVVASVGARWWLAQDRESRETEARSSATSVPGRNSLVPTIPGTEPTAPKPEPWKENLEDGLPVVTESGFFALVGFALGYLARKILKLGLILLALVFVLVQGLSYLGVVTVDWSRAVGLFNDLVLNVKQNETWGAVLEDRLPSGGGLALGYILGFRKK